MGLITIKYFLLLIYLLNKFTSKNYSIILEENGFRFYYKIQI